MPLYDYVCRECRKHFEIALTLSEHEAHKVTCPRCGSKRVEQEPAVFYAVTEKKS